MNVSRNTPSPSEMSNARNDSRDDRDTALTPNTPCKWIDLSAAYLMRIDWMTASELVHLSRWVPTMMTSARGHLLVIASIQ